MILFILCSCEEILFTKRSHFWFTPCMLSYNVNIIQCTYHPSKHAGSDLDVFWLWPIMTIMTSVQPESGWIIYGLDGPVSVWPNTSGLKASWYAGLIGPSFWQDTTGPLLVSHFQTQLSSSTNVPDNIIQNQPSSDLVLLTVLGFGQMDPVWKQANVQKSSSPLLPNASQLIQTRCESDPACFLGCVLVPPFISFCFLAFRCLQRRFPAKIVKWAKSFCYSYKYSQEPWHDPFNDILFCK